MIDIRYIHEQLARLNEQLPTLKGKEMDDCVKAIKKLMHMKSKRQLGKGINEFNGSMGEWIREENE